MLLPPPPVGRQAARDALARVEDTAARARAAALPLLVSPALWELRAVPPKRLPETTVERDCSLEGCPA